LSSTTSRPRSRGQVLVIFAGGAIAIIAVAALVFDIGQNLFGQRMQQDASDAAALSGARWLVTASCVASPSPANCPEAVNAAMDVATDHGYASAQVAIHIPPGPGSQFAGIPGHIQVTITSNRASYFAGALGIGSWNIGAATVAANQPGYTFPYSLVALSDTCYKAGHISGNGTFNIGGSVYVEADCTSPGSLVFDGNNAVVNVTGSCSTPGTIGYGPYVTVKCGSKDEDASPIRDPLAGIGAPPIGLLADPPLAPQLISGSLNTTGKFFNNCPRQSTAGTASTPKTCILDPQGAAVTKVRLYPGVYYGGVLIKQSKASEHLIVYLEPGIYYMAGGGFEIAGDVDVYTVNPGGLSYGAAGTSGVMIYNTDDPAKAASCKAGILTGGPNCIVKVDVNDAGGQVKLRGYSGAVYTTLLVFQDRDASSQPALKLTGSAQMTIEGTLYLPKAHFAFNGNGASTVLHAQVICDTFDIGGGGSLTVTWDPDHALQLHAMGLVE
jgi:Flp pilus assembly protein TadG